MPRGSIRCFCVRILEGLDCRVILFFDDKMRKLVVKIGEMEQEITFLQRNSKHIQSGKGVEIRRKVRLAGDDRRRQEEHKLLSDVADQASHLLILLIDTNERGKPYALNKVQPVYQIGIGA